MQTFSFKKSALMAAASGAVLALSAGQAMAQVCNPNPPGAGQTVTCTAGVYGTAITFAVDDLTVVVGDAGTPTSVEPAAGNAIDLSSTSGDLSLTVYNAASTVTSVDGVGVNMINTAAAGSSTIDVEGTIYGSTYGVYVNHAGTGAISVDTGSVIASNGGSRGVRIIDGGSSGLSLTSTGFVEGRGDGIEVDTNTSGATVLDIDSVRGRNGDGIDVNTYANSTSVTVTTGDLRGGRHGVNINHNGTGDVTVNTTGTVTADSLAGVRVRASGTTGGVFLYATGDITSVERGFDVVARGNGPVTIDADGAVYSTTYSAIDVYASGSNGDMTITTDGVVDSDGLHGIKAYANSLTATMTVTNNASVTGARHGMKLRNRYTTTVNVNGDVTGEDGFGIFTNVRNGSEATFNVNSGTVSGTRGGIVANAAGGINVNLAAGATISGGTGNAILSRSGSDVLVLSGTVNGDIRLLDGGDDVTFNTSATINGGVDLGAGSDNARLQQDSGFGTSLLGGLGFDRLYLEGVAGGTLGGVNGSTDLIRQFEVIEITGDGWTLGGDARILNSVNVSGANAGFADGITVQGNVNVATTGSLDLGDGVFVAGNLTNEGVVSVGGTGTTGFASLRGNFAQTADGSLNIDALSFGDNDAIRMNGGANLDGTLNLNQTYALTEGADYSILRPVSFLSGTFATVNGLGSGAGLEQSVVYDGPSKRVLIVTALAASAPEEAGSKSAASATNYTVGLIGASDDYAKMGFAVGTLPTYGDMGAFAAEITPDSLDGAMMLTDGAATRFGAALAGCDMNFSLNAAESCAVSEGEQGARLFGEMNMSSANTGSEVGHNFNAKSFDLNMGVRLSDSDDAVQYGLMTGYSKGGSLSEAFTGQAQDGLSAETFSVGAFARRDAAVMGGVWSLDATAMASTSEAKMVRNITPGFGLAEQAQSEFTSRQVNLQGRATLESWGGTDMIVKPLATVGNRTLQRDGFTETGAQLLGLTVDGETRNVSYAGFGAEMAPDFTDENGLGFKGLLRVTGLAYAGDTDSTYNAYFTGAGAERGSFTQFGQGLDTSVLLEGGFSFIASEGFAIGAEGFSEMNPATGDSSTVGATLQLKKTW